MVIGDLGFQLSLGNLNLWRTTHRHYPLSALSPGSIFDIYLSVKEEAEQRLGNKAPEILLGYQSLTVRLTAGPVPVRLFLAIRVTERPGAAPLLWSRGEPLGKTLPPASKEGLPHCEHPFSWSLQTCCTDGTNILGSYVQPICRI